MSHFQNWVFEQVHGKKLIYNTCWEDPRCDRKLLQLQSDSKVVVITSAGDNALDYLLEEPAEIHAVDMNYRQNALLEIKRSLIEKTDHSTLFQFFGEGHFPNASKIYTHQLRTTLPDYAQQYWDKHIHYFSGRGLRKSFYYRGASGVLAYICRNYIKWQKIIRQNVEQLFDAQDLHEQSTYYQALEKKIFTPFVRLLLNNHYTMCLAGVPQAQQALIQEHYSGGNDVSIKDKHLWLNRFEIRDQFFCPTTIGS